MASQIRQLTERWKTPEGYRLWSDVSRSLQHRGELERVPSLTKWCDRWDLRGMPLKQDPLRPAENTVKRNMQSKHEVLGISGKHLVDVDFSFADASDVMFDRCNFKNVVFDNSKLNGSGFWSCSLERSSFVNVDLRQFVVGAAKGKIPTTYQDVRFEKCRFPAHVMGITEFQGCEFIDCRFDPTDFDGSRFHKCQFIGSLSDLAFHAHANHMDDPLLPWQRLNPKDFKNEMKEVDFRQAKIDGVGFDGVDLKSCYFPPDPDLLVIRPQRPVFSAVLNIVKGDWSGRDQQMYVRYVDFGYITPLAYEGSPLSPAQANQETQIMSRSLVIDAFGQEKGNRLFELVKSTALSMNALVNHF